MKPLTRRPADKHSSAKRFRSDSRHTKAPNMAPPPMRGGFRL